MGDQKALEMEVENINKVAKKCLEENEKLQVCFMGCVLFLSAFYSFDLVRML